MEHICQICDRPFKYKKGLSKHLTYTHHTDLKIYYDAHLKLDKEEICPICGKFNSFRSFRDGYTKLCGICLNKTKFPNKIEYWIYRGHSIDSATNNVSSFQSEQSKKVKNKGSQLTKNFYINKGYSVEESIDIIKARQSTFSLDKCIIKHGKDLGKEVFIKRQEKWQATLDSKTQEEKDLINKKKGITLERMISKWGEIQGTEKYHNWKMSFTKRKNTGCISTISQEIFFNLLSMIEDKENAKFGKHNKEFYLFNEDKLCFYDFKYKNKIIEFNGDIWHANPSIFNENDTPNPYNKNLTSQDIWDYDKFKFDMAKINGYDVLVIWEADYKKSKELQIQKCIEHLNI